MLNSEQKQNLFELYPVLAEVDQDLLRRALAKTNLLNLRAGITVFDELQPCNAFPFMLAGHIRVYKQAVSGRELSLYNVKPGDACVVTAGCLLGDEPYNASGQVKADSVLVMMAGDEFENLMTSKKFRTYIFSLFSRRVLGLMQLVEEVAFHRLDRRLATLLLRQSGVVKASHQELADELGTVREMVTRLLNSFSDSGLISLSRGQLEVIDPAGLQTILDD